MLCAVGNLTLPTPVVLAGAGLCLLAGALIGYVAAPDATDPSVAKVASYDSGSSLLCLTGDAVQQEVGAAAQGRLCGTWRHSGIVRLPREGDRFRFVVVRTSGESGGQTHRQTVLYGDVVR